MRFLIPSYDRADTIQTPRWLVQEIGVAAETIQIGVQGEDQLAAYQGSSMIPTGCRFLMNHAHNPAGNRNALMEANDGELCLILDDDIRGLSARNQFLEKTDDPAPHRGTGVRQRLLTVAGFFDLMLQWCAILRSGASMVTVNMTDNSGHLARLDYAGRFLCGVPLVSQVMMLVCSDSIRFDESYDMVEDTELGARMYRDGQWIVRDTGICPRATNRQLCIGDDHARISGGITHLVMNRSRDQQRLCQQYPDIIGPVPSGSMNVRFRPRRRTWSEYENDMKPVPAYFQQSRKGNKK